MAILKRGQDTVSSSPVSLSIVAPIYNCAPFLEDFVSACKAVASGLVGHNFEIVLVDDGSTDASVEIIRRIQVSYPEIVLVELSRNFGQHMALLAGLRHAVGADVACLDGDGDEDPAWIAQLWERREKEGTDLAIAVSERSSRSFLYQSLRSLFGFLLGNSSSTKRHELTARLMKRPVVDGVSQFVEQGFYFGGAMDSIGFSRTYVIFEKGNRKTSGYHLFSRIRLAILAVTAHSVLPLRVLSLWGLFLSVLSALVVITLIINGMTGTWPAGIGWISILVVVTFVGGNSLFALGVLGEYLAVATNEAKRRPQYHVRAVTRNSTS